MNIRLSPGLFVHRWGRLLLSVLGLPAGQAPASPGAAEAALVMMLGEEFAESPAHKDAWLQWAKQPSHVLLLLPPFQQGTLIEGLDWQFALMQEVPQAPDPTGEADAFLSELTPEVSYELIGRDGTSNREAGHCWRDGAINTRYWKAHANSGIFAATCLPLGSISLLGEGAALRSWLGAIHQHVGRAVHRPSDQAEEISTPPSGEQMAVLVCCYACGVATAEALRVALSSQVIPVMKLSGFDLEELFIELRSNGWLEDAGLSISGLTLLRDGHYWRYAEELREMAQS